MKEKISLCSSFFYPVVEPLSIRIEVQDSMGLRNTRGELSQKSLQRTLLKTDRSGLLTHLSLFLEMKSLHQEQTRNSLAHTAVKLCLNTSGVVARHAP